MASLIPGYSYDIFISYRQEDNKGDRQGAPLTWATPNPGVVEAMGNNLIKFVWRQFWARIGWFIMIN
jgi:hypothetical protein